MARSKHTDTRRVRAARRVRAPRQSRGDGDLSDRRALGLRAKAVGLPPATAAAAVARGAREDAASPPAADAAAVDAPPGAADYGPISGGTRRGGIVSGSPSAVPAPLPRVRVQRPRAGYAHPA